MRSPRRLLCLTTAALAAAVLPAGAAHARTATVRLLACQQARQPAARHLVVEASMRATAAGERLEVRFDLYRRSAPGGPVVRVPGPGLGSYNRAAPGVSTFRFRKRIANLSAAGDYRVVAMFRWLGPGGRVLERAVRAAPLCHQAELRPDLLVSSIATGAVGADGGATYVVTVRNAGATGTGSFVVGLTVGAEPALHATVAGLGAGQSRRLAVAGPPCPPGGALTAVADAGRAVPEASESNNARSVPCSGG